MILIQEERKLLGSKSFALFSLIQKSPPFSNPGYATDDDYCNCTEISILNRFLTLAVEMSDYHFQVFGFVQQLEIEPDSTAVVPDFL